ncbi:MAG: hypothetical protein HQL70_02235 [Magnetococcales bacterium]|nr:hypothetical protein [Magnetococcales bacterium]
MGQYLDPEGWLSFDDYMHGVRREVVDKQPVAKRLSMPDEPESWVSEQDYYVNNVRRSIPKPSPESYIECLRPAGPEEHYVAPPEASITMIEAIDEVMAPTKSLELASRLMMMAREDQRECDAGLIEPEELERRRIAASIIQENHNRRAQRIADWYLENYFRAFETPESEDN